MTINEWFEDGCDYETGVNLFAELTPNKAYIHFFRGDPRFKDRYEKLKYELKKLQPKEQKKAILNTKSTVVAVNTQNIGKKPEEKPKKKGRNTKKTVRKR